MGDRPTWDEYLMAFAELAATRSHDSETRHGAVIVDADHRILGVGYNGLPRGGDESKYPTTRPLKYPYMVHAEMNAILNAGGNLRAGTMYVTGCPCPRCFTAIIQVGIVEVVYGDRTSNMLGEDERGGIAMMAENHGIRLRTMLLGDMGKQD